MALVKTSIEFVGHFHVGARALSHPQDWVLCINQLLLQTDFTCPIIHLCS